MKNSVSDRSFYIESSDDEDLEKGIDNDDGNESDSSGSSADNQNHNQPSSYTTAAWPQSYRFAFSSSPFFLYFLEVTVGWDPTLRFKGGKLI